jgi:hypothetical protein
MMWALMRVVPVPQQRQTMSFVWLTTLGVDRRNVFAANARRCAGLGEQNSKADAIIAPPARRGPPVVSCENRVWLQAAAATASVCVTGA